jgi:hypothetical protein
LSGFKLTPYLFSVNPKAPSTTRTVAEFNNLNFAARKSYANPEKWKAGLLAAAQLCKKSAARQSFIGQEG